MSDPLTRRHNRLTKRELRGVERVMALDGNELKDAAVTASKELFASDKLSFAHKRIAQREIAAANEASK